MKLRAFALLFLWGSPALAQGIDPAAATELFARGRNALKAGDYPQACSDFEESERLDSKVGTLLNLALCEEQLGRLKRASEHWQKARDLAQLQADARAEVAREKLAILEKRLPRLTIRLSPTSPPGTLVQRDSIDLGPASLGVPLPVDPGRHILVASAKGFHPSSVTITLQEGETRDVDMVVGPILEHLVVGPVAPPTGAQDVAPALSAQKKWAIASTVVSGAALSAGIFFGARALAKKDESGPPHCDERDACDDEGLALRSDARAAGDVATVSFIVSGVALLGGAILWFSAPKAPKTSVTVSPFGMNIRGEF